MYMYFIICEISLMIVFWNLKNIWLYLNILLPDYHIDLIIMHTFKIFGWLYCTHMTIGTDDHLVNIHTANFKTHTG